jgi:hypothetical protein
METPSVTFAFPLGHLSINHMAIRRNSQQVPCLHQLLGKHVKGLDYLANLYFEIFPPQTVYKNMNLMGKQIAKAGYY